MKDIKRDLPKPNCAPNDHISPAQNHAPFSTQSLEPLEPTFENDLLYIQALNGGWNLPTHHRQHALNRLITLLNDPNTKPWLKTRAQNALDRAIDADPFAERRAGRLQRRYISDQRLKLEYQKLEIREKLALASLRAQSDHQNAKLALDHAKLESTRRLRRHTQKLQAQRIEIAAQKLQLEIRRDHRKELQAAQSIAQPAKNPPTRDPDLNALEQTLTKLIAAIPADDQPTAEPEPQPEDSPPTQKTAFQSSSTVTDTPASTSGISPKAYSKWHAQQYGDHPQPAPAPAELALESTPPNPTELATEPPPQTNHQIQTCPNPIDQIDSQLRAVVSAKRRHAVKSGAIDITRFQLRRDWLAAQDPKALTEGWLELPYGKTPPQYSTQSPA
jgi:hypothetical protein